MRQTAIWPILRVWIAVTLSAASSVWTLSAALSSASVSVRPAAAGDVSIADFAFAPAAITVSAGSTVSWVNAGTFTHTATSDSGVWDSGSLGPAGTFTYTFNMPGVYAYHCTLHVNMTGTVTALASVYLPLTAR